MSEGRGAGTKIRPNAGVKMPAVPLEVAGLGWQRSGRATDALGGPLLRRRLGDRLLDRAFSTSAERARRIVDAASDLERQARPDVKRLAFGIACSS